MNVQQPSNAPRLPLAALTAQRFDDSSKDAKIVNGYIEQGDGGELEVVKRPGLVLYRTGLGTGMGAFNWEGRIYSIEGGTLYEDGVSKGAVNSAGGVYTFSSTLGNVPSLFLHNAVKAYRYSPSGGLIEATYATSVDTTGTLNSTTVITAIPTTAGITANAGVLGTGIPLGAYVVTVDSGTQVTISQAATTTATGVSLVFLNDGFPTGLVKGQAFLDGTTYVMQEKGRINGSEINNLAVWDALNFISAQIEPDKGVFLAKQLVYVIALKEWSAEAFYDAGNPDGSPLAAVQGGKASYGCRTAGSVQDLEGTLLWVGSSKGGAPSVLKMDGLKVQPIGNPAIDRLVAKAWAAGTTVWSWSMRMGGHRFYGVTFKQGNLTLVFDLDTGAWYRWTDTLSGYWPYVSSTFTSGGDVLLQHETTGSLYRVSMADGLDAGQSFPFEIVTPNWDGGTLKSKTLNNLYFLGDQEPGVVLQARCNDNDYQTNRWSNWRTVNLGSKRPRLERCGSFQRRAYHLRYIGPARVRLSALEADVDLGTF